tara:strand:- start:36234 stop:36392 length:159 start_codon:yes stop_codon:yes gene_type:complete
MDKQKLVDLVLNQITKDVFAEDLTAIEELVIMLPEENLVSYLPEERYKELSE